MRKITNTKAEMEKPGRAMDFLRMGIIAGPGNAIEMQEGEGQRELVKSAQLPTYGLNHPALSMIRIIGHTEGDPMFSDVVLPDGWRKQATDHPMWSHLLDDKGRRRGSIFYKAAFYDRSARISPDRRYSCGRDYDYEAALRFIVKDNATGKVLFTSEESPDPYPRNGVIDRAETERRRALEDANEAKAKAWINEHFPNWGDASAYWD